MIIRALPPVRRPVPVVNSASGTDGQSVAAMLGVHDMGLFASGTDALTQVLRHARLRAGNQKTRVLLPAYGCPDLVAACVGAGVEVVLVDTAADYWGYDLAALQAATDQHTLAIIAVNLLGCGDQAKQLMPLTRAVNAYLVQDSAQHLSRWPGPWLGDYQVLSFGKGKPLNLLGGGAALGLTVTTLLPPATFRHRLQGSRLAACAFNFLTDPRVYPWLLRMPGMGIGATVYHPPGLLVDARPQLLRQLASALPAYRRAASYRLTPYLPYLDSWRQHDLEVLRGPDSDLPLSEQEPLRLPMLAGNREARDRLVAAFSAAGFGATAMYQRPLYEIAGMPEEIAKQGPFPNASRLAERLFTLPTHDQVTDNTVRAMDACLRKLHGSKG